MARIKRVHTYWRATITVVVLPAESRRFLQLRRYFPSPAGANGRDKIFDLLEVLPSGQTIQPKLSETKPVMASRIGGREPNRRLDEVASAIAFCNQAYE